MQGFIPIASQWVMALTLCMFVMSAFILDQTSDDFPKLIVFLAVCVAFLSLLGLEVYYMFHVVGM